MARVSPQVLAQIYKTGAGANRPIAAYLVGRQAKLERERQEQIDTLNAENIQSAIDLRGAQAEKIRNPPPVEPEHPPMNMRSKRTTLDRVGQLA